MGSNFPNYSAHVPLMNESVWRSEQDFKYELNDGLNWLGMNLLDWIFPNFHDFYGYRLNPDDLLDFTHLEGDEVIWENNGPVAFVVIGLLLSFLMLIGGISWCIVKFCCCCLRNRDDLSDDESFIEDSKREKYSRIGCSVGLGIWIFLFVMALFGCFVANEHTRISIRDLTKDLGNSLDDTEQYLNITKNQINAVFVTSYRDFEIAINKSLFGGNGPQDWTGFSSALDHAEQSAAEIGLHFGSADKTLTESKVNIMAAIKKCSSNFCREIRTDGLQGMQMSPSYDDLKSFIKTEVHDSIRAGSRQVEAHASAQVTLEEWLRAMEEVGRLLRTDAKDLTDALDKVPFEDMRSDIDDVDEQMQKWIPYLYFTLLATCIFLLAIPVILVIGSSFGCCGRRSRGSKGMHWFKRRRGASFMNCGIFSIFLVAWVLWILSLAAFIFSGVLTQIICEAVRDLEKDNLVTTTPFESTDGYGTTNKPDYKLPTYGEIVRACKNGRSAYDTFQMEDASNVEDIRTYIRFFPEELPTTTFASIDVKPLEIQLDDVINELKHFEIMLGPELFDLASLRQLVVDPRVREVKTELESEISELDESQKKQRSSLKKDLEELREHLENAKTLAVNILENAQLAPPVQEAIILDYMNFVIHEILFHVGDCGPLWNALDSTIKLFCYKVAAPVSAFWISLTVILILFIPLIITAIVLERLYRSRGGYTV